LNRPGRIDDDNNGRMMERCDRLGKGSPSLAATAWAAFRVSSTVANWNERLGPVRDTREIGIDVVVEIGDGKL
jgi:hypothetical protein